jgi:non-ribosomal peptide synthetase component F
VRLYPDRIAVKTGDEAVTYAQLNTMADRMAHAIVERRGSDAEAVGILLETGPRLMAAMLAVLKAGKFFILLNSSFPKARNAALLDDSQAWLVITNRENASRVCETISNPSRLLELESINSSIISENWHIHLTPQRFATIAYTSGSTGDPKGVIWNHQDCLHRIMLRTLENRVCEHDRIALLTAGTANAVTNAFFALLNGAMLCTFDIRQEGVVRLAKWLADERITICPFSSSLFRSFTAVLTGQESFPDLRIVRLRSETVLKSDFELFKKHFPRNSRRRR